MWPPLVGMSIGLASPWTLVVLEQGGADLSVSVPEPGTNNRPAVWFLGGASHWTGNEWTGDAEFSIPSSGGFSHLGTGFGQGPSFSYSEGINTVRSVFRWRYDAGVQRNHHGGPGAFDPVWGLQIKACNLFAMTDRRRLGQGPSGSPKVLEGDELLGDEEPVIIGMIDGTDFSSSHGL